MYFLKTPNFSSAAGCTPCVPLFMYPQHINFFRLRRACPLSVFSSKSVSVPCPLSVFGSKPAPYPVPCPLPKPFRTPTFRTPKIHFFRTPGPKSAPYPVPCPFLAEFGPYPYLLVPLTVLDLQKISLRTPPNRYPSLPYPFCLYP